MEINVRDHNLEINLGDAILILGVLGEVASKVTGSAYDFLLKSIEQKKQQIVEAEKKADPVVLSEGSEK